MKNNTQAAIEALDWFEHYIADDAQRFSPAVISVINTIRSALQSKSVDVEELKQHMYENIYSHYTLDENSYEDGKVKYGIMKTIDHLHEQGII